MRVNSGQNREEPQGLTRPHSHDTAPDVVLAKCPVKETNLFFNSLLSGLSY